MVKPTLRRLSTVLPLGHAALAYLSYVGIAGLTRRPLPVHWALVPLGVASQLPDLVDKPLSYHGLIISGRSLGHSLVTAIVLVVLVWLAARWVARAETGLRARLAERTPLAFAVGYLSHLLGDSVDAVLAGPNGELRFLLWPLLPPIDYPNDDISPVVRLLEAYQRPLTHPQLELILLAAGVLLALEVWDRTRGRPTPSGE
jgi:hypothetical protein